MCVKYVAIPNSDKYTSNYYSFLVTKTYGWVKAI